MKFSYRATAVTAVGVLALAACSSSDNDPGAEPSSSTASTETGAAMAPLLNLGVVDSPGQGGFVAADMSFATKAPYGQAIYDTLVRATPDNLLEPALASDWGYDSGKTELTLKLRDDVKFTDGTDFNADAAAQNILRFRDGSAENANWLANVSDAVAKDPHTLVITLSAPDPALLLNLSRAAGYQQSPASFDTDTPVGSGPYVLDQAASVVDASYIFDANPDYWASDYQHYDEIAMTVFDDPVSMQNALMGDQLDAALFTGYQGFDQIEGAGYTAHEYAQDWEGLLLFDRTGQLSEPMGDVRVRQSINFAIDKEGLLQGLAGGRGEVTTQVFGKETPGYDAELEYAYPYDPEKAKSLLAEAGYADGFTIDFPTVSFVPQATFDLVGQQLAEVGITANFTDIAPQDYFPTMLGGNVALASFRLEQPATAWETYSLELSQGAPWNSFHTPDDAVAGYGEIIQTGSDADSAAAAAELNKYIVDQAWFNPWYRTITTFYTDAETDVTPQVGNVYPYLWNIVPVTN
ncbi:ABC transporter substrate-binding protein [Demequina oxidasica]|uniref:ABC transporter substrate-binding protein n=1 Tax=Demequina oxidasica TaxID=676199 RepID=UPI000781789E|nr:ABC transporter substrate-binding protein [Demequina oxidasica]